MTRGAESGDVVEPDGPSTLGERTVSCRVCGAVRSLSASLPITYWVCYRRVNGRWQYHFNHMGDR